MKLVVLHGQHGDSVAAVADTAHLDTAFTLIDPDGKDGILENNAELRAQAQAILRGVMECFGFQAKSTGTAQDAARVH